MKSANTILVEVNGKVVVATVTVEMPGITPADHLSAGMLLTLAASGQSMSFVSRHDAEKTIRCTLNPTEEQLAHAYPPLRRVA